jgi:protein arginine N-methyltransferase 1
MNSVDYYVSLLEDRPRVEAFLRAISRTVRPGDTVVEIGCGIGTYALAALKAGAAHVTAIDFNPVALAMARELGLERNGGGRLRLVEAPAGSVELPRRADVVIFEDYGSLGHAPGLRPLLEHVRTRFAAPGARWLPGSVDLLLAPVDKPLRTLGTSEAAALPFSADALALLRKRALNDPFSPDLDAASLAAPGQVIGRLVPGEEIPLRIRQAAPLRMARSCGVTGLVGWIRLNLGDGIVIDNPPSNPPPTYPPVAFPFEEPLPVVEGETVELVLETIHGPGPKTVLWQWSAQGSRGRREGSSTNGIPGDLELLRRGSPAEIPRQGVLFPVIAAVCGQVDGKKPVSEIAKSVYASFKGVFPDERAATAFVLEVLEKGRGLMER